MGPASSNSDLKQLYRRWLLELWNGDLAVAEELVTGDFTVHQARADGRPSEELHGPEAVVQMVRDGHAPFEDLSFRIEVGPIVEGDLVAARWVGRGRYRGGMPGATGLRNRYGAIDMLVAQVSKERMHLDLETDDVEAPHDRLGRQASSGAPPPM